jgi:hypothetical protein
MKAKALILLTGFIYISFSSNSQSTGHNIEMNKLTNSNKITKGYYSIYNNIKK